MQGLVAIGFELRVFLQETLRVEGLTTTVSKLDIETAWNELAHKLPPFRVMSPEVAILLKVPEPQG